jgi:CheY-like chemotaxis protein
VDESQGRLLIVEDDSALRRSLRTTLGVLGFDVAEASNGEDALVRRITSGRVRSRQVADRFTGCL